MRLTSILPARLCSMSLAMFCLVSRTQVQQCFKLPCLAEGRLAHIQNNVVLPSKSKWTSSPILSSAPSIVKTPRTESTLPSIVKVSSTESIQAVVVGLDEDSTALFKYQPTEPEFIEPLDTRRKPSSFLVKSQVNIIITSTSFAGREVPRPYQDPTACASTYYHLRS